MIHVQSVVRARPALGSSLEPVRAYRKKIRDLLDGANSRDFYAQAPRVSSRRAPEEDFRNRVRVATFRRSNLKGV